MIPKTIDAHLDHVAPDDHRVSRLAHNVRRDVDHRHKHRDPTAWWESVVAEAAVDYLEFIPNLNFISMCCLILCLRILPEARARTRYDRSAAGEATLGLSFAGHEH